MPNPLSDLGWSDRDYAAAIGTLAGEVAAQGNLTDYHAIADVIANRLEAGVYGKNVAGITMNPREFSTWSPKERHAFANARAGFAAALNPNVASQMPKSIQSRVELAQKALNDVMVTGVARGITQGATAYHNPEVTAKLGTGAWHNKLENQYGSVTIGQHSFTGPGFRPDQPFDPITYNGMLDAPPSVEPFLGDVGIPLGRIESSPVPDITPATSAGFSLDGFVPAEQAPVNLSDAVPDFSSITAGTAFDPLAGFKPADPVAPDFSGLDVGSYAQAPTPMDKATFNDVFDAGFPEQKAGFSAGFDAGPFGQTPDFNAPSLEQRNAEAFNQDAIKSLESQIKSLESSLASNERAQFGWNEKVMNSPTLGSFDTTRMGIRDQEAEFGVVPETNMFDAAFAARPDIGTLSAIPSMASMPGPSFADLQTPQAPIAPAPVSNPQVAASSTMPMGDYDPFSTGFQAPTTTQPQVSTRAPSTPASTAPTQEQIASTYDLPSFDLPSVDLPSVPTVRDIGSTLGLMDKVDTGFMNAMANPDIAQGWSPGMLDGWTGKALAGAARGALTGGLAGAAMGGLWGGLGIGDRLASEWDRYANAYANLTPEDFRAFGLDGNWTDREPTMNTGMFGGYDGRGGGRVGDGSYSEYSGRNDNNPQGIL